MVVVVVILHFSDCWAGGGGVRMSRSVTAVSCGRSETFLVFCWLRCWLLFCEVRRAVRMRKIRRGHFFFAAGGGWAPGRWEGVLGRGAPGGGFPTGAYWYLAFFSDGFKICEQTKPLAYQTTNSNYPLMEMRMSRRTIKTEKLIIRRIDLEGAH